jgi:hypothetical protein
MLPDEPTDEERQEELPGDNGTPFRPADTPAGNPATQDDEDRIGQAAGIDDTHPATDTNMQPEEQYDEGVSGAAEAQEPNAGNSVTAFSAGAPAQDGGTDAAEPADSTIDTDDGADHKTAPDGGDGIVTG